MPRRPRLHVPGGFYHVILRGNHRQSIFFQPQDRDFLDNLAAEVIERFKMRIHAYCWMTNHIHLALSLDALIQHLCEIHSLSLDALSAPGRQRKPAKVRALVLHHAVRLKLATLSQLARRFQRSPSTLAETLELYRCAEPDFFKPLEVSAS